MHVGLDKADNIKRAVNFVKEASLKGSKLVALPECFNSPYGTKFFPEYAEKIPDGTTCQALSSAAKDNKVGKYILQVLNHLAGMQYNSKYLLTSLSYAIYKHTGFGRATESDPAGG